MRINEFGLDGCVNMDWLSVKRVFPFPSRIHKKANNGSFIQLLFLFQKDSESITPLQLHHTAHVAVVEFQLRLNTFFFFFFCSYATAIHSNSNTK